MGEKKVTGDAADISYLVGKLRSRGIKVRVRCISDETYEARWVEDVKLATT